MCWRKDVKWGVHTSDDPKKLMSVTSGEYVLAIPDYSHEARYTSESPLDDKSGGPTSLSSDAKNAAMFRKVIMKLSGDVEWVAGLVFERNLDGDKRSFTFKPHYDVVLQNPKFVDDEQRKVRCGLIYPPKALNNSLIIPCRITMLSEDFGVITFIYRLQSSLRKAGIGVLIAFSHRLVTTRCI